MARYDDAEAPKISLAEDHAAIAKEALTAILSGKSKPLDHESNPPRSRIHQVRLKDGRVVKVSYDRRTGEVTKVMPDLGSPSRRVW